ncbi:nucleoside 2-deoxyribosyltransferase [Sabulicella glaciei]|uniref:Nucleoside 2-deoxyribosyltransferase n=1 Tax=Sabulicella glaciei TaxID=2984948 RepID=A0ABT3NWM3_9PROT|nr:nucleoside 2-deoxyribosyltransferase [Roseococcus sp. MDT2-1-1]MCW8086557.1 nucleoside 2-deoxyribosyltransferase [Roseococcus sp. MDT2-1-1]
MRLYLAGPEVFLPDADAIGAAKKALCAAHGIEGAFPLDPPLADPSDWRAIHARCEEMLRGCDALLANLSPFRGAGADPGTVFEMGLMRGLGRPVHGYMATEATLRERIACREDGGAWRDAEGLTVEDFGLGENLMLEGAIAESGGMMVRMAAADPWRDLAPFEEALRRLSPRRSDRR